MQRVARAGLIAMLGLLSCNQQPPGTGDVADESALAAAESSMAAPMSGASCEALQSSLALPDTEITKSEIVAAGAFAQPVASPPGIPGPGFDTLPEFCRVTAVARPSADSLINIEIWMPSQNWNGKFVGVGNGVWAGSIAYFEMVPALARGYATAATDDGHQGSPMDASFAAGHPEKLIDFGHRAVHEMTLSAQAAIEAYYGRAAQRSLFASCSTGGRQGLMEAYRYPDDYDGISAMAPANPMTRLMIASLWTGHVAMKDDASRVPQPKLAMIHKAAVAACDAGDGAEDGIIGDPERCAFDPGVLQCGGVDAPDCLTGAQVEAMRAIYDGARNPRTGELIYPGFSPGSEMLLAFLTQGPEPFGAATTYLRGVVFGDPNWDFKSFDYDAGATRAIEAGADALDVLPANVEAYVKGGGKLLLSHGWTDGLIPARSTLDFYNALAASLGEDPARDSVRLFMAPGVDHCAGGDGPFVVDWLGVLDAWVETGEAPRTVVVADPPGAPAQRTRPLCPHPQVAKYKGEGSPADVASFECIEP